MKLSSIIPILFILCLMGPCTYFVFFEPKHEISVAGETVGTINLIIWGRSGNAKLKYTVDGIDFEAVSNKLQSENFVVGDKFKVVFDRNDPGNYIVDKHHPVILDGEQFDSCYAEITDINNHFFFEDRDNNTVTYRYRVQDKTYTRCQYVEKSVLDNHNLKVGNRIEIYFWTHNPQRSIMRLVQVNKNY